MQAGQAHSLEEIKSIIKEKLLIERLELEDITPEDITDDMILFGEGLGLDSIEAFEVIVGLEEMFGINVQDFSSQELRNHLKNVESIAALIMERGTPAHA